MVIRSLQLLPVQEISISNLVSTLPATATSSKRKANDESPPSKKAHVEESDSDTDIDDMLQCKDNLKFIFIYRIDRHF